MTNFHALLIGIDHYEPNPSFGDLGGTVNDIQFVRSYLEKSLQLPSGGKLNIKQLTSPLPNTQGRVRALNILPTYENILKAFAEITEEVNEGDFVYIHYSGHGQQAKTIFNLEGKVYDEALVPMDLGYNGRYLRDVEMPTLLKRLTDRGAILTVIFDSCHSGGATRADGKVRGSRDGEPDTSNQRPQDSLVAKNEELEETWKEITGRKVPEGFFANNDNEYVFLGACRPSELAKEGVYGDSSQGSHGALTYFMINALTEMGKNVQNFSYQDLYDRIKGQIQSKVANQVPMLLGKANRLIFGENIKTQQYSLGVLKVNGNKITLDGGIAQGLSKGTRFALYTSGSDYSDWNQRLAILEMIDFDEEDPTKSICRILDESEGGITTQTSKIEAGLVAIMESLPILLKHKVRFFCKEEGEGENQLPADLVQKQKEALKKVRQAMQGNGWLMEINEGESAEYQVAVGKEGEYEISKQTPITNLTPVLSIDDQNAPQQVVERLVHLGKYDNAIALTNSASSLGKSIEFELLDENKQPFPDSNNIVLKSGDRVYLKLKNSSNQTLNAAVLDFEATWEISQIPIQGDRGAFYELGKGEETFTGLRFRVPNTEYYEKTQETLKLFITRGTTNFQWLLLPPLDKEGDEKYRGIRGELKATTRSAGKPNALTQLLSAIGQDKDNPPETRRAEYIPDPDGEWFSQSIVVTIEK